MSQPPPLPVPATAPLIDTFEIKMLSTYVGARIGLPDKTAVLAVSYRLTAPQAPDWSAVDASLDQSMARLLPGDALTPGWRNARLLAHSEPQAGADPVSQGLAERFAHLVITLMQWGREPVESAVLWQGKPSSLVVGIEYENEQVVRIVIPHALRLLLMAFVGVPGSQNEHLRAINQWLAQAQATAMSPANFRFMRAAKHLNIPVRVRQGFIQLGWGAAATRLNGTFTHLSSNIAVHVARIKIQTNRLLAEAGLPVPRSIQVRSVEHALAKATEWGWPVVIKPGNQDQGTAVVPDIQDTEHLKHAFEAAAQHSPNAVIVEQHVPGADYRMLVVGGALKMVTRRHPAGVWGDGDQTVATLIEQLNADPRRGQSRRSLLIHVDLDEEAQRCLRDQGLTPQSVPAAGRFVRLRRTANLSTGGTAEDVTDRVHPDNRAMAIRATRVLGLDIAGVDFLCPDISRSWHEVGGAICEVNAQPGLRVHWLGDPQRDINTEIIDWLMRGTNGRIPTAAITGTNGKSTVARMLHHIWQTAGKVTGVCTTNGLWVGDELVSNQNFSGLPGARMLFNDPAVEAAVIELPRKGLLQFGHPCDRYDVAALLNVQNDHIGVDGIDSLDAMADLKAEVLARAHEAVVVNAEDPRCMAALKQAGCVRHILVAMHPDGVALRRHLEQDGEAVFAAPHRGERWVIIAQGIQQTPLMSLSSVPATMAGRLPVNESNTLFAIALAWAQGVTLDTIRQAMTGFANTPAQNPGRYNWIEGFPFQVLLDYGHNPAGVKALCEVVRAMDVQGQRLLLNLNIGNRHQAHLQTLAPVLAKTFERFVLGCDEGYASKSNDYAGDDPPAAMLAASQAALLNAGVDPETITTERCYRDAIRLALNAANPGDLVVLLAEPWDAFAVMGVSTKESE